MTFGSWLVQFGGVGAIIAMLLLLSWLICPLWVIFSRRSEGGAKFGWFLITFFFSWLGFAVFLIATQRPKEKTATEFNRIEPGLNSRSAQGRDN
jgi:hypothetical protein